MIGRWMTAAVLGVCLVATPTQADDDIKKLDGDEAKKFGQAFTDAANKLDKLALKINADVDKGTGIVAKKRALFVIPDTGLKLDTLKKLDKEIVPLGMLYTHRITLVVAEQAVPEDKNRVTEAELVNKKAKIVVMQMAVAKVADQPVLLVYTTGKSPALVTTLVEVDDAKDHPLVLEAGKGGDNQANIVLTVLGKYRASFTVAGQD